MQKLSWHTKTVPEVLDALRSREHGLTKEEAAERLREYGPNKLPEGKVDILPVIFLRQFQSPLIYILFAAAAVIFAMGSVVDASVVLVVLLFNAIVGTIQEGKARNTLRALKRFAETSASVTRDGHELIVPDTEVVPGDIIVLQEGEKIPADARIIFANTLTIDEAGLTGESEPADKTNAVLLEYVRKPSFVATRRDFRARSSKPDESVAIATPRRGEGFAAENIGALAEYGVSEHALVPTLPVADQNNMVFKGTHVLSGNGSAVVVATGLATEIGKIAEKIAAIDTEIPLKTNIRYLSRVIIVAVSIISASLIILGILSGNSIKEMFTTAVALSVSIIPEGLPIVMTLVLATGVWRMSKRHVLVKRLQAVEALGQTKVIAVDKTGTLTRNEMVIQRVYIDGNIFEITGNGYEPKGEVILSAEGGSASGGDGKIIDPLNHPELLFGGRIAAFCAGARVLFSEEEKIWRVAGDPTEAAMLVLAEKIGFRHETLEQETPKIFELPFDYRRKYHATIRVADGKNFLTVAGAHENVLELCRNVWRKDKNEILDKEKRQELESVFSSMAQNGFRVVAIAINSDVDRGVDPVRGREGSQRASASNGVDPVAMPPLTFVGFLGMKDALRPEVYEAVHRVKSAGIRVIMITGDHRLTAQAVAKEADIYEEGDLTLTGEEIDIMSDEELALKLARTTVFARVTPDHKLRIIQAYRKRGEIVAMTGDGVNDAPSLVAADLGVAMGKIGTEVAKEASDIVLLDDNFASIVSAAEEGRSIYKAIKKVILYLFSTSIGEVFTIAGALVLGYPLPVLPAQIIWLNFVTDGFLDVALAMEPKEKGLMRGKFERPKKWIVDGLMARRMFLMAVPMAIGTLYLFREYLFAGDGLALGGETDLAKAWTISLTALAVYQWFNAWNCRSESKSIFQVNPFSNMFLVGATTIVVFLQLAALHTPFLQKVLRTQPLALSEWLMIVSIAASIILVEEIRKFFYRRKAT